jgi:transposase-like protein
MGQVLHGSATTTAAIRRAIQHSQASLRVLARRHGINPKTVAKWRRRDSTEDRRPGPTVPKSTVLSVEQEAILVAFRKHTLLPGHRQEPRRLEHQGAYGCRGSSNGHSVRSVPRQRARCS